MSQAYLFRLRKVRDERNAAFFALTYVTEHWDSQDVQDAALRTNRLIKDHQAFVTRSRAALAGANISLTYFVRLTAEFEGILKDHLQTNYPALAVPAKPKVDELLSRIIRSEALSINAPLRVKLDEARDYRNAIAHRSPPVTFDEALARCTTFVSKLADPLV